MSNENCNLYFNRLIDNKDFDLNFELTNTKANNTIGTTYQMLIKILQVKISITRINYGF